MMRPLASLLLMLLACTSVAWADTVVVTTLADEDNVVNGGKDTGCSFREAVRYMDLPSAQRTSGYGGCKANSALISTGSDTIDLPTATALGDGTVTAYQLTLGEIPVTTSVTITGTDKTGTAVSTFTKYPVIQAQAGHRIFSVEGRTGVATNPGAGGAGGSSSVSTTTTNLTLSYLVLKGCGSACAVNGGIIYVDSNNNLTLTTVNLSGGVATAFGGAVYLNATAALAVTGGDFEYNSANNGAAIAVAASGSVYVANVQIAQSLFAHNTASVVGTPGAIISLAVPVSNLALLTITGTRSITSSTIANNTGIGLQVLDSASLNNLTIVENSVGGIDFRNAQRVLLANSIVAGNPDNVTTSALASQDCINAATPNSSGFVGYNAFTTEACLTQLDPTNVNSNQVLSNGSVASRYDRLMAGTDSKGNCPASGYAGTINGYSAGTPTTYNDSYGLLCPLASPNVDTLAFFKPRLLAVPANVNVAPIAGQGDTLLNYLINSGSPSGGTYTCVTSDQRGKSQRANACDLGAVAVQASASVDLSLTTPEGQQVTGDFLSLLGDVDLLPMASCAQVNQPNTSPQGQDGCWKRISTANGAKGSYVIDPATNQVVYTPGSNFYGEDTFSFLVATTLSRYSDLNTDPEQGQFVEVDVTVSTTPPGNFNSAKVDTGAFAGLQLLGLGGMLVIRRWRRVRYLTARNA